MFYKGYSDSGERQEWRQGGPSSWSLGVSASAVQGLNDSRAGPILEHEPGGVSQLSPFPGTKW